MGFWAVLGVRGPLGGALCGLIVQDIGHMGADLAGLGFWECRIFN